VTGIRVGSETYDLQAAISGATLNDLKRLQLQTKSEWLPSGVTPQSIQESLEWLGERAKEDDFKQVELLGNLTFMDNLAGLVFLARRKAGEHLEVSDAGDVAFTDIQFVNDDEDDAAPLDEAASPDK
jgi:hypothetical protein